MYPKFDTTLSILANWTRLRRMLSLVARSFSRRRDRTQYSLSIDVLGVVSQVGDLTELTSKAGKTVGAPSRLVAALN